MSDYDLVAVGTGFASTFFVLKYLERRPSARVLFLERGFDPDSGREIENHKPPLRTGDPLKRWVYTLALGGGSNCWWACTPRMLPNDFRLRSRYGVGSDWPISYDELEPYYQEAEENMSISGPDDAGPQPRSRPFPQPPHKFTDPDKLLKAAYPDLYFNQATARARRATAERPMCCSNGDCSHCPINAKFMIRHDLHSLFQRENVFLRMGAEALRVETRNDTATAVVYRDDTGEHRARGDTIVLGANAIFNPLILQNSGFDHSWLGAGLCEQHGSICVALLDGVDNFQGSTVITGQGYMLYDGEHRQNSAACMIEVWNKPVIRPVWGKWRQRVDLKLICEDLPDKENTVRPSRDDPFRPVLHFKGRSEYLERGLERARSKIGDVLKALPVEHLKIETGEGPYSEAHILCTARMGANPEDSVVDAGLVHHKVRNLIVAGGSAFPTAAPANPSLTIAALSLSAAERYAGAAPA